MAAIGFGLERVGLVALRRPRLAAVVLAVLTLVSVAGLSRLSFDDDVVRAFRSDSENYARFAELAKARGDVLYNVAVVASADRKLTADDLAALREFHFDLEFIDGVETVLSLFAQRELRPGLEAGPPVVPEKVAEADLAAIFARAETDKAWPGRSVSPDRKALLFVVIDREGEASRMNRRAFVDAVRAAAARVDRPGLTLAVLGTDVIRHEIADSIQRDIALFSAGGCAISVLLAMWWFRNWRLAFLSFLPATLSVMWVLGFASLFGMPMTVTTDVVPVLLIVMAFSDGMHLVHDLRGKSVRDQGAVAAAIGGVIRRIGPACALTSLTTSASLLSFNLSGYGALADLAWLGGIGTLVSFFAVIVVFPVVGQVLIRPADLGLPESLDTLGHRASQAIARVVPRRPRLIVAGGTALLFIGLAGQLTTTPAFNTYENIPEHSAVLAASIDLEDRFGGVFASWARFDAAPGKTFADPDEWSRLAAAHLAVERAVPGLAVVSPLTMARAAGHADRPTTAQENERIPHWFAYRFGDSASSTAWIAIFTGDANRNDASKARFDAAADALAAQGLALAGSTVLVRHDGERLIARMNWSLLGASVASIALIVLAFRNPWLAAAIGLANVTPDLLTGAALHVVNDGYLTVAAGLAMTIAFGIAIDDTIHVLNRIDREVRIGRKGPEAVVRVVGDMSPLLGATTLILIGGLALTLASDFSTVRSFGVLTMAILAFAVFGDLLLLPAVLLITRRWARR